MLLSAAFVNLIAGERGFTVKMCLSHSEGRGCTASGSICVRCFRPVHPVDSETSPHLVQSTVPGQAQSKGPMTAHCVDDGSRGRLSATERGLLPQTLCVQTPHLLLTR